MQGAEKLKKKKTSVQQNHKIRGKIKPSIEGKRDVLQLTWDFQARRTPGGLGALNWVWFVNLAARIQHHIKYH